MSVFSMASVGTSIPPLAYWLPIGSAWTAHERVRDFSHLSMPNARIGMPLGVGGRANVPNNEGILCSDTSLPTTNPMTGLVVGISNGVAHQSARGCDLTPQSGRHLTFMPWSSCSDDTAARM